MNAAARADEDAVVIGAARISRTRVIGHRSRLEGRIRAEKKQLDKE